LRCSTTSRAYTMTTFDKREDAFEKQFAHDEELKFKATARRNKLLGLWAAGKTWLKRRRSGQLRARHCHAEFEATGERDVMRKIRKDFDAKGVAQSDHQIERTMSELMATAVADIKAASSTGRRNRHSTHHHEAITMTMPHSRSHAGFTPEKRSSPDGAACPIRSSPKRWRATGSPR